MNTVITIIIIILCAVVIIAAIIAVISICSGKKKTNEIHFFFFVDMDSGRLSTDNNFFKGFSGALTETTVVGPRQEMRGLTVTVKNLTEGSAVTRRIADEMIIGREGELRIYDKYVSRKQCKLIYANGGLYLCNLSASNQTRLNGEILTDTHLLKSGDKIGIGKTKIEIVF